MRGVGHIFVAEIRDIRKKNVHVPLLIILLLLKIRVDVSVVFSRKKYVSKHVSVKLKKPFLGTNLNTLQKYFDREIVNFTTVFVNLPFQLSNSWNSNIVYVCKCSSLRRKGVYVWQSKMSAHVRANVAIICYANCRISYNLNMGSIRWYRNELEVFRKLLFIWM